MVHGRRKYLYVLKPAAAFQLKTKSGHQSENETLEPADGWSFGRETDGIGRKFGIFQCFRGRYQVSTWQTSTHSAPISSAMRAGLMRSALLVEPAAGTTSLKALSETSQ